jgi:hypothetical protein
MADMDVVSSQNSRRRQSYGGYVSGDEDEELIGAAQLPGTSRYRCCSFITKRPTNYTRCIQFRFVL